MKNTTLLIIFFLLLLSACAPSQIKPTETPQPSETSTPFPTRTRKAYPTSTPPLMNIYTLNGAIRDGFQYANSEYGTDMLFMSAEYEGLPSPNLLLIKARNNSLEYFPGCWQPLLVISYGILREHPKTVFPADLSKIKIECYNADSYLVVSYQVSLEDAAAFGAANNIDVNKLEVIKNEMPTSAPEATSTSQPTPTPTAEPINTLVPVVQPTANTGNCSPAYPDVCIPPPPPDLNCKNVPYKRFRVLPPDPHNFDSDGDGIGCES